MAYSVRRKKIHTDFTERASVGTTYDLTKGHAFDLDAKTNTADNSGQAVPFKYVEIGSIWVFLTDIAGATQLTVRVCMDSTGNTAVLAEGTGTIMPGLTDSGLGSVAIHGLDYAAAIPVDPTTDQVYMFFKTDAGTVTVNNAMITTVG